MPQPLDGGVDCTKITPEWIEQVIDTNASPRIQGLRVAKIELDLAQPTMVAYVITVPQATAFAPHQNALDNKYYRRFERRSVPMHDYEIRDVLHRATTPELWIKFSFDNGSSTNIILRADSDVSHPTRLNAAIGNSSREPALYAVIDIYIDLLCETQKPPEFKEIPGIFHHDEHQLKQYSLNWGIQGHLPIFAEAMFNLATIPFSFTMSVASLRVPLFYIGYKILAPGFSTTKLIRVVQVARNTFQIIDE